MKLEPFKIEGFPVLAIGKANFQIIEAADVVSKKEAENGVTTPNMLRVKFQLWDINGKRGIAKVWFSYAEDWRWKLGKLLEAVGLEKLADTGDIDPHLFQDKAGKCNLGVEEYNSEDRTVIKSFIKKEVSDNAGTNDDLDDDIPF